MLFRIVDTARATIAKLSNRRRHRMDQQVRDALRQGHVIDITTTGRKSGQARRIEIVFHAIDGRVYISGFPRPQKRSWLANLEAHPDFTFHLKGDVKADLPARARPINDPAERRPILTHIQTNTWPQVDLEDAVSMSPLVEVTFPDA
jgi:deazaflavin-dependent oxidoreductase (nitroreductase family)